MQVLFQSSAEGPSKGLGIIPCPIERFNDADKAVPHIGWNVADPIASASPAAGASEEIDAAAYYYFVHSY